MSDQTLTETLNRAVQHGPPRQLAVMAASWLVAVPMLLLAALAVRAVRRRDPQMLALTVVGVLGSLVALGVHQLIDHLSFRPRPYWALGAVHAISDRRGDSAFFSRHAAVAAALTLAILLSRRSWGLFAAATTLLVGLAVGAAATPPCSPPAPPSNAPLAAGYTPNNPHPYDPTGASCASAWSPCCCWPCWADG
jgi:hypothetical protein